MSATAVSTQTGRFVWRDLMTTDAEKAKLFYSSLFGWTIKPVSMDETSGMSYDMIHLDANDMGMGGVVPMDTAHGFDANHQIPSHWISYIATPNVDETVAKVAELGGQVKMPGMDIPNVGRFAVVSDSQGAHFQPFQDTGGMEQPETRPGEVPNGGVSWNELLTSDVDGAISFYGSVFGYGTETMDMGQPYTILKRGDHQEAGLMKKPDEVPVSAWTIYFYVDDLDATLANVSKLGGQPFGEIIPVPGIGRVSWASDPTGAVFGLHEGPKE